MSGRDVLRFAQRFSVHLAILIVYCAIGIGLWSLVVRTFSIDPLLLPGPDAVWHAFLDYPSLLLTNTLYTLEEAMLGFAVALGAGVLLAMTIVSSPRISSVMLPTLAAVNAAPKVVVAPMLIIWLGLGMSSKIGMAFLLAFFPIVISTAQGLSDVEPDLLNLYRLMRSGRLTIMRRVRLPNAVPHLMSGMKIGIPLTIIGAVIEEYVGAERGIGHQIVLAYSNFATEVVFAAIILITIASVILFQLVSWLERQILRWRPTSFEAR